MIAKNRRLFFILLGIPLLLLVPLIAMQFSDAVNWSASDFLVMGILLLAAGLVFEFILRNVHTISKRIVLIVIVTFVLLLVWAELAVGIFGTPFAGS